MHELSTRGKKERKFSQWWSYYRRTTVTSISTDWRGLYRYVIYWLVQDTWYCIRGNFHQEKNFILQWLDRGLQNWWNIIFHQNLMFLQYKGSWAWWTSCQVKISLCIRYMCTHLWHTRSHGKWPCIKKMLVCCSCLWTAHWSMGRKNAPCACLWQQKKYTQP
jgi:hypothetical protein